MSRWRGERGRGQRGRGHALMPVRSLRTTFAAIRALVAAPHTAYELGEALGVHWRTAYRIVHYLEDAGIEVLRGEGERNGPRGAPASAYRIRRDAVRVAFGLRSP